MFRRHDGTPAQVPPYRKMMPYLMKRKAESVVLFEQTLDVSAAMQWLDQWNRERGSGAKATFFHLVLHSMATLLHERPRLNRFVVNKRIYDRKGVFLTFAAKKAMNDEAPLATVKREFRSDESFAEMVNALTAEVTTAKSNQVSRIDKELTWFLRLPGPLLSFAIAALGWLDRRGLAPQSLLGPDPMYTSVFIANLGSIKIDAAYHHLYEYGNCPLFATIGVVHKKSMPQTDGSLATVDAVMLRYTYDERIEDGLYCAKSLQLLQQKITNPSGWLR